MCFTYLLLIFYVVIAIFKPYLWILVVLIFESTQMIALLTITDSLSYKIYFWYSVIIGFNPGFINFLSNMNFMDKSSYHSTCFTSFISVFFGFSELSYTNPFFNDIYHSLFFLDDDGFWVTNIHRKRVQHTLV